MIIETRVVGKIEIDPDQVINFPEGIPAFEREKEFVLIPVEGGFFYYLQAVKNTDLCLLMTDPFLFFPEYQVDLPADEMKRLETAEGEKSLAVYTIVNVPGDFKQATVNLLAPVIINVKQKKGLQFIPIKSDYKTKQRLFEPRKGDVSPIAMGGR